MSKRKIHTRLAVALLPQ